MIPFFPSLTPLSSSATQHFGPQFQLVEEKLESLANEYAAIKDMLEDWTTKILKAVNMMRSDDNTPTSHNPHWPTQMSSPVPTKTDEYYGNIQNQDNEKLDNNGNKYVALKDMMDDWMTEILKAVRTMKSGNTIPNGNTPHWPTKMSSHVPNKSDEYYGNIQQRDNEKFDKNGNKHHSHSQSTPTACNRHGIPSVHQPTDTPAQYLQPILPWTQQHLASYLALAEVACPWNVEPG